MKILRLDLAAYGPFTDITVDLSAAASGLHILYGPNEAGKSSAMRALHGFLFGIPERTPDAFLHPYPRLRVGGTLQSGDGNALAFIRRKGRGNTLRRGDDETVAAETELQQILGGVDADAFSTLFGIDHSELVRGGEEIISGGGDLGRTIFAAGSGMVHLRNVQENLLAEADLLYKSAGQKPRVNQALRSLTERRRALRQAELSGPEWAKHSEALASAKGEKAKLEAEIAAVDRERSRLQRIRDALPMIARRSELATSLEAFADAVPLPEDFPERRRELLYRLRIAETERSRAEESAKAIRSSIEGLAVDERLLDSAEPIEILYRDLGGQQKAARDRAKLEALHAALAEEGSEILRGMGRELSPEQAERLRIGKADAARIRELGARYERTVARIDDAAQLLPEIGRHLEAVKKELKGLREPRPIDPLVAALAEAERCLSKEDRLQEVSAEIRTATEKLTERCRALGLDPERVLVDAVPFFPTTETIRRFEERLGQLERRRNEFDDMRRKTQETLMEIDRQMTSSRLDRDVPEEDDLLTARRIRDAGWQLAARRLRGENVAEERVRDWTREVPGGEEKDLVDAYQSALARSDGIADRLRREAERVAAKARLSADRRAGNERLRQISEAAEQLEREEAEAKGQWVGVWREAAVEPGAPREMLQWVLEANSLMERSDALRLRRAEAEALQKEVDRHRKRLASVLSETVAAPEEDTTLGEQVRKARRIVAEESALTEKRRERSEEKSRRERELAAVHSRLEAARADRKEWADLWSEAVQPLGLDADALPAEAAAVMEELNSLFEKQREAKVLEKRIAGIDRDAALFRRQVSELVAAACPEIDGAAPEDAVLELNHRLRQSRDAFTRRQALHRQLEQESSRLDRACAEIVEAQTHLGEMCREAGCSDLEQLPEAERRSMLRSQTETEWRAVEDRLRELSAGASVASFLADVQTEEPDELEGTLAKLAQDALRLAEEKSTLDQAIGTEQAELARMDGSAAAAQIAEEIQMLLGRIEADAERYARFRIAAAVLQEAVERFRRKNQGPVLQRTSELFARLTLESFSGVRADFDERGQPRVVGVRPSGEIVAVEGMSDGTADQLYLSFRLAGLEHYLRNNEPLPFVVDDILLQFDDGRASAALQALSELSVKTQVLFFTHHRHLVELAEQSLGPERFGLHRLDRRST